MLRPSPPAVVSWEITQKCNLACVYCYGSMRRQGRTTSRDEGDCILDQIEGLGAQRVILSGGEPMLHPDLDHIVQRITRRGTKCIICSNGTEIDGAAARRLRSLGIESMQISLDTPTRGTNNALRIGEADSFGSAIAAVAHLKSVGIAVAVGVTATRPSILEFDRLVLLLTDLGVDVMRVTKVMPTTGLHESYSVSPLAWYDFSRRYSSMRGPKISFEKVPIDPRCKSYLDRATKTLAEMRFAGDPRCLGCSAGSFICAIDTDGNVTPCPVLPVSCGNVFHTTLTEIWQQSPILCAIRARTSYGEPCVSCHHLELCGGCRAEAYMDKDDVLAGIECCPSYTHRSQPGREGSR